MGGAETTIAGQCEITNHYLMLQILTEYFSAHLQPKAGATTVASTVCISLR
jgi:hypothetical protein